jgi:hypothetical protein
MTDSFSKLCICHVSGKYERVTSSPLKHNTLRFKHFRIKIPSIKKNEAWIKKAIKYLCEPHTKDGNFVTS